MSTLIETLYVVLDGAAGGGRGQEGSWMERRAAQSCSSLYMCIYVLFTSAFGRNKVVT